MRPIDFVIYDGDSEPNIPAHVVAMLMQVPIEVRAPDGEYEISSYYHDNGRMVLDVQRKDT